MTGVQPPTMDKKHFIVESLALARPGGLVVVLRPATRSMQQPGGASGDGRARGSAGRDPLADRRAPPRRGTDALTDLLIFRRRLEGAEPLRRTG